MRSRIEYYCFRLKKDKRKAFDDEKKWQQKDKFLTEKIIAKRLMNFF
jgi:hypothetical protein